ncbi:hypothetical protein D9757_001402 [Collybiopsis confluens]|uniref:Uncharacterized protein n=1 Tax=Collybiopsis confluens TaxID=2823264 RepID=A0A8H5HZK8_9AGAR|nr:hypothetical protein D9757_001402 [Collybiopsis confluens]
MLKKDYARTSVHTLIIGTQESPSPISPSIPERCDLVTFKATRGNSAHINQRHLLDGSWSWKINVVPAGTSLHPGLYGTKEPLGLSWRVMTLMDLQEKRVQESRGADQLAPLRLGFDQNSQAREDLAKISTNDFSRNTARKMISNGVYDSNPDAWPSSTNIIPYAKLSTS